MLFTLSIMDAELFENNREVYRKHLEIIDIASIVISLYNPNKNETAK
jgi:precorrin-3B methylase